VSDAVRFWRRGVWVSLAALLLALLSLAPYFTSSTEMVRMRHALLLADSGARGQRGETDFNWTPANVPADFMLERGAPYPEFADVVDRLGLKEMSSDWERALAISRHLLGSSPVLSGGAIQADLRQTHRSIVTQGQGYCGDFVRAFVGLAIAAGLPVRAWAFSFDGFGGHGHIWPEIWNRQLGRWQLVGIFNNNYFLGPEGVPLSALEFRRALREDPSSLRIARLDPAARPGFVIEEKAWEYYRQGLGQWYMVWGNNVFSYDRAPLVRTFGSVSRSLEQLGGIAQGVYPPIRIIEEPGNRLLVEALQRVRVHLWIVGGLVIAALLALLVSLLGCRQARRSSLPAPRGSVTGSGESRPAGEAGQRRTSTALPGALQPHLVVLTNLFPHSGTPGAGMFIRARMFRVAAELPMTVVVPVPWFPLQGLIRCFVPNYRPPAPRAEVQEGIRILLPRYFSVPGLFRGLDSFFIALACLRLLQRLTREAPVNIIDAHFAYPCGHAAVLLGRWLGLPVTITMRGSEVSLSADPVRRRKIVAALNGASRVFSVSDSLRRHAGELGADTNRIRVVGNGVDLACFFPEEQAAARSRLGLPLDAPVLVSAGGLVERKGFHRVIDCLPALRERFPGLRYLVVGGPSPEGDIGARLKQQVASLGLDGVVHFLGALPAAELRWPLSAADVFVLATSNEGWANVFLEAMACGLPVVTTDVGGNAEVVSAPHLGSIVPFADAGALTQALAEALDRDWDRQRIRDYAAANTWDSRVAVLVTEFRALARSVPAAVGASSRRLETNG
jgi:Glycosyltransferase